MAYVQTFVTTAEVHKFEPSLANYYPSGYSDWSVQIAVALREILQSLKNNGKKVRLYCTPLSLQNTVSVTVNTTGTAVEDIVERMAWSNTISAGSGTLSLYGSNDNDTFELITTATATGTTIFTHTYKYYRVDYTGSSCTYSSALVETSFYLAHIYLTLSLIYRLLADSNDDFWINKANYYNGQYETAMNNMLTSYDDDESDSVTEDEQDIKLREVWFTR
jgi:hypothetical protein